MLNTDMKRLIAIKYRIYPTSEQQILIGKTFGCKRLIYNRFKAENERRYLAGEPHLNGFAVNKLITPLKKELEFLCEVDMNALQGASADLAAAYDNMFKSRAGNRKGKRVEEPRFKSKHGRQSYRTPGRGTKVLDNAIKLPKLKEVKAVIHRPIPEGAVVKSITVPKNPDDRYYASVLIETDVPTQDYKNREVGFDLGIKDLMITSSGLRFLKPDALLYHAKTKQLLKRKQKQFARTTKGSKNHEKLRIQVARLYSKITRQRNEYYHILSKYLVATNDVIYLEDLAVSNLLKNRKLSRAIHEIAWSTLSEMIKYKAEWAGVLVQQVGRFYPSSKTCSCCGHKLESLDLATREWECPSCGEVHDRDLNAATNILHEGQRLNYGTKLSSHATGDVGVIPEALLKMTSKIERSTKSPVVSHGSKQARRSLVVG
jgi:putative transposase